MKVIALIVILAAAVFAADLSTNSAFFIPYKPNTNQIQLVFKNRHRDGRQLGDFTFREMDYTATNVIVESAHEPILLGKTNGVWLIIFR